MIKKMKTVGTLVLTLLLTLSFGVSAFASDVSSGLPIERTLEGAIIIDMTDVPVVVGDGYVEFEIPFEEIHDAIARGTVSGNHGVLNAFFPQGVTSAQSGVVLFDWRNNISIPANAVVTELQLTSRVTTVPNVTYHIGFLEMVGNQIHSRDYRWAATVRTTRFNGRPARGIWGFDMFATRVIPNPALDFGAAATMQSGTLRLSFR